MNDATLAGREPQIAAFDKLLRANAERRIMLVDGLSGTGKSWLAQWLKRQRSDNCPVAYVQLTPATHPKDILRTLVAALSPANLEQYTTASNKIMADLTTPLHISQNASAQWGGRVANVNQNVAIDYDAVRAAEEAKSVTRHLDLLSATLQPLADHVFVLMFDEFEHALDDAIGEFITARLVPRLRQTFTGFRLYLTGQSVPLRQFARHERDHHTLQIFSRQTSDSVLSEAGIEDTETHALVYAATQGHPLMTGMLIDEFEMRPEEFNKSSLRDSDQLIDDRDRTRWIYDRVISRFADPALREIAAYLSLFEWFDRGLLRAAFDTPLGEAAFNQMVDRRFIKKVGRGRWVCHDVIRTHLEPQRVEQDPDHSRALYERAYTTYLERLDGEAERTGEAFFDGRLNYVSAALHAVLSCSASRAHDYLLTEVAATLCNADNDYVFALARMLARHTIGGELRHIAKDTSALLQSLNLYLPSERAVSLLATLGQHAAHRGDSDTAQLLLGLQVRMLHLMGKNDDAVDVARYLTSVSDAPEHALQLAEALANAARYNDAFAVLARLREVSELDGDVGFCEAQIHIIAGEREEAKRKLMDVVAAFPTHDRAHLSLARSLFFEGELDASLLHTERVNKQSNQYGAAQSLRCDVLAELGRFDDLSACASDLAADSLAGILDTIYSSMTLLSDPKVRGRVLAELDAERPDPSTFSLAMLLAQTYAREGNLDALASLCAKAAATWPEARYVFDIQYGAAHVTLKRWQEAIDILSPLVEQGVRNFDAYLALAEAYRNSGELKLADDLYTRSADTFPALADFALSQAVMVRESMQSGSGLDFLDSLDAAPTEQPYLLRARAVLLAKAEKIDDAIELLMQLVHTFDRSALPIPVQIDNRKLLAIFLNSQSRRDETRQVADELIEHLGDDHKAILTACEIYNVLGDIDALQETQKRISPTSVRTRHTVMQMLLTQRIVQGQTTTQLLSELTAHPDRLDVVGAIMATLAQQPDAAQEFALRIEQVAPGALADYNRLNFQRYREATESEFEQLRQLVADDPDNMDAKTNFAFALAGRGDIAAAIDIVGQVTEKAPQLREFATAVSVQWCLDANDLDRAQQILAPFIDSDEVPDSQMMINVVTAYYSARDDSDSTLALHENILKKQPQLRDNSLQIIIHVLIARGDHEAALERLREIDIPGSADVTIEILKVAALRGLKRNDEALGVLAGVLKLSKLADSLRAKFLDMRGDILRDLKRPDDARVAYNDALRHAPNFADAHLGLALIERDEHNWHDAYRQMLDAITLKPGLNKRYEDDLRTLRSKVMAEA